MDWSGNDLTRFCSEVFAHDHAPDLFVSEARFGLFRLLPILSSFAGNYPKIVEIGAGSCILSAYLASKGLSVTAVEPLQSEFDYFSDMQATILEFSRQRGFDLRLIRATGENFHAPGQFDIAFTINALEYMPDPLATLDNMYDSLRPGHVLERIDRAHARPARDLGQHVRQLDARRRTAGTCPQLQYSVRLAFQNRSHYA